MARIVDGGEMRAQSHLVLRGGPDDVRRARALAETIDGAEAALQDDAALVLGELAANATLHGRVPVTVTLEQGEGRVRIEVADAGRAMPVMPRADTQGMTGRGLSLVAALASRWGVAAADGGGKAVWAELCLEADAAQGPVTGIPDALPWATAAGDEPLFQVRLGAVPTQLLLDAKSHIDDIVREVTMLRLEAEERREGMAAPVRSLVSAVTRDFALARASIKRQALESAARGDRVTNLTLELPLSAADAGERYLAALEDVDRQSRAGHMLTLAPPLSHVLFRRWYLQAVVDQLRAAAGEGPVPDVTPFALVLAEQVDAQASLLETQTRLQLLQTITRRLTEARSPQDMAQLFVDAAVEHDGVESCRVFLVTDTGTLLSTAWRGGTGNEGLHEFPMDADLPAAAVARSGEPLHARRVSDLYDEYPVFEEADLYPADWHLHLVPLSIAGTVIGVMALTFREGEVEDAAQQAFVVSIADALAQALERGAATERVEQERRREAALLRAQADAMTHVVAGHPLVDVLDGLLRAVESASADGLLASVLLLDDDGQRLRHGAAPSLPADYNAAIDGLVIGPAVGSCGTAAFSGERVVVEDVLSDPRWEDFRELATDAGVRACWSTPIRSSGGDLLGTFALYYRRPHAPGESDLAFIDVLVGTVALIIERSRSGTERGGRPLTAEASERLAFELAVSAGGVGTFDWDLITGDLAWDDNLLDIFGFTPGHPRVMTIEDFFASVHPGDKDRVQVLLDEAIATSGMYEAEYRIVLPDGDMRWVAARGRALAGPEGTAVRLVGAAQDTTARREADARVARVMDALSTAFFFLDRDWRFTFLNAAAERVLGRTREHLLHGSIWEEFPASVGSEFEVNYRHAMTTGETVAFDAYYPEPLNAWYEVQAWPGPDGLAVYFIDVTERRAAQHSAERAISRAGLLARVTEELAGALDTESAMRRLAQIITSQIADYCVVTLISDDAQSGTRRGLGQSLGWHNDPERRELLDRYAAIRLAQMTDDALIVKAVETADPQIVNGDALDVLREMFPPDAEPLRMLTELDTWAMAIVPLVGQEHPVGMLSVVNTSDRGAFSDEDLDLIREVAARAGLVLDRARLYRQQRQVAEGLQRSLLTDPRVSRGTQVSVAYVPAAEIAQVGGDWYDAFTHADGSSTIVIGDVMGHDVLAAAAMGETRTLVRALAVQHRGAPAPVLDDVEHVMGQLSIDTLATVLIGHLVPSAGQTRFTYSSAGHPPPLLLHADGRAEVLTSDTVDTLLGVGAGSHTSHEVLLPQGASLLLYTDGLVERRDQPVETGIERLRAAIEGLRDATPDEVRDRVLSTMLPAKAEDDVALLVVRPEQPA